ncbi:hypothetical protein DFS34DRAFT_596994 [Phlyctochytrium arcticum]|nr:hypothetical protein DFS34DRAFT_596994 [Phlyctochytrium arcticum]
MAKGDRKEDQVDPANIHPHWFLNKTFTPATNQREARLLPPIAKKKNARARIPTAAETASKKKTRCSICSVYGHNKSKCPTRIEVANNNARLAAQAQQQQEIFSQPGSSSQASRQSSPTHSIQSSSQHHSSYGYDPLRVTAPRRQYMSQEYFSQYDHSSQFQTNWPQATLPPTRYVTYIGHQVRLLNTFLITNKSLANVLIITNRIPAVKYYRLTCRITRINHIMGVMRSTPIPHATVTTPPPLAIPSMDHIHLTRIPLPHQGSNRTD